MRAGKVQAHLTEPSTLVHHPQLRHIIHCSGQKSHAAFTYCYRLDRPRVLLPKHLTWHDTMLLNPAHLEGKLPEIT